MSNKDDKASNLEGLWKPLRKFAKPLKRAMHKADGGLMDNTRCTSLTANDKRKCRQWAGNKPGACGNAC